MAFQFNKDNAFARVQSSSRKDEIVDLHSALKYVQEKVAEFEAGNWKKCPWIAKTDTGFKVEANLFNMPLYWTYSAAKPARERIIRNPDMTERTRTPEMIGSPMYKVTSEDDGKEMLKALASGTNKDLNEILERAALALVDVLAIELPHIEERAATVYAERGHVAKFGEFGEPNENNTKTNRMRIGSTKQNAMNSAKQKARTDLGYKRAMLKG